MEISDGVVGIGLRLGEGSAGLGDGGFADLDLVLGACLVGDRALFACAGDVNGADLRGDAAALVLDLPLEPLLRGESILQGVEVGTVVDLVEQAAFFYEVVIVYGQLDDGTGDQGSHADDVGHDLGIVGARIVGNGVKHGRCAQQSPGDDEAADEMSAQGVLLGLRRVVQSQDLSIGKRRAR